MMALGGIGASDHKGSHSFDTVLNVQDRREIVVPAQSHPQKAAGDVMVLQAYEGSWKLVMDNVETKHSTASHEEKLLRNDCWHSGSYYACNQYVDGDSKVLLVFIFDATKQIYTSYQVPLDGSATSSGTLEIRDNIWTYLVNEQQDLKPVCALQPPIEYRSGVVELSASRSRQEPTMTYSSGGKQFIVNSTGGHRKLGTKQGDYLIAFALP